MIHIDLLNNPPDTKWIKKAEQLTKQLIAETDDDKRKKIIDNNAALWGELKTHLLNLSHHKCWYSEAKEKFSHYHVDHFRPKKRAIDLNNDDKGGYWWLTFDWKNYRVSGSVGNTKKGDRFCVLKYKANSVTDNIEDEVFYFLDPIDEDDPIKLTFNDNGEAIPYLNDKSSWDYIRVDYTINNLDLNYELLVEARRELWAELVLRIKEIQNLIDKNNSNPSPTNNSLIKEKLKQLKEFVKPQKEFSSTAKACLISSGLPWAIRIAA
jgi:uncharacterized protein (TIGR02646 family)